MILALLKTLAGLRPGVAFVIESVCVCVWCVPIGGGTHVLIGAIVGHQHHTKQQLASIAGQFM